VAEGKVSIYDKNSIELVKKLDDFELVSQVDFSPTGKYLVMIQKPSVNNNLKIIDLKTYETVK
jgi:uncharacterized protein with WD repeat